MYKTLKLIDDEGVEVEFSYSNKHGLEINIFDKNDFSDNLGYGNNLSAGYFNNNKIEKLRKFLNE